jgi:hypothetical protein
MFIGGVIGVMKIVLQVGRPGKKNIKDGSVSVNGN